MGEDGNGGNGEGCVSCDGGLLAIVDGVEKALKMWDLVERS
jgi:hypothetical protein